MIIHQTTNESLLIFAVDFLTVKHMIFDNAIKNFPVIAQRLFARNGRVSAPRHCDANSAPRHCDAPRVSKAHRSGMGRLRGLRD
jgi:hypothetical protein